MAVRSTGKVLASVSAGLSECIRLEQHMRKRYQYDMLQYSPQRAAAQIRTIAAEFEKAIQLIEFDIATEENRARIVDPTNFAYPTAARALRARRDNLKATVTALRARLPQIESDDVRTVA